MTRWARFRSQDGRVGFGVVEGTKIAEYEGDMFAAPRPTGAMLELRSVVLESPCRPSKIVALWNNFNALAAKLGKPAPAHPLYFIKSGTSVIGPGAPIQRPQSYRGKIVYEGELGVVIGRRCKDVELGDAAGYVFGYTCVNDVTAAEVIGENGDFAQWCRSKSYDTFGCLGPVIVTEVDLSRARILTMLDGSPAI
jgi:2-keto-4-pentenoate hydratase/2-oxohepta-3-ene-1,7-dioic acid hydratase in catechol pathway